MGCGYRHCPKLRDHHRKGLGGTGSFPDHSSPWKPSVVLWEVLWILSPSTTPPTFPVHHFPSKIFSFGCWFLGSSWLSLPVPEPSELEQSPKKPMSSSEPILDLKGDTVEALSGEKQQFQVGISTSRWRSAIPGGDQHFQVGISNSRWGTAIPGWMQLRLTRSCSSWKNSWQSLPSTLQITNPNKKAGLRIMELFIWGKTP